MVDTEYLVLSPVGLEGLLQLARTAKILSEWLLYLFTSISIVISR